MKKKYCAETASNYRVVLLFKIVRIGTNYVPDEKSGGIAVNWFPCTNPKLIMFPIEDPLDIEPPCLMLTN